MNERAEARKRASDRVKAAHGKKRLKAFDYFERHAGQEHRTLCKKCGITLRTLVPHETLKFNGMPLAVLAETPMYAEIEIEMEDGTHTTPICKQCLGNLDDEDLDAIYAADLASWERTSGNDVVWETKADRKIRPGKKYRRVK